MSREDFAGFGIKGYRSFGSEEICYFGPLEKVHLIVGRNDVGKSNALKFVLVTLTALRNTGGTPMTSQLYPEELDIPDDWTGKTPRVISLGLRLTENVRTTLGLNNPLTATWLSAPAYTRGCNDVIWLDIEVPRGVGSAVANVSLSTLQFGKAVASGHVDNGRLDAILRANSMGSTHVQGGLDALLRMWQPWSFIPDIEWVDAIRQVTAEGVTSFRNGSGLIANLAKLQQPSYQDHKAHTAQFKNLQTFIKDVLDDAGARIEIPHERNTILVHRRGNDVKPLENVGTGIGEVIFLAAVATTLNEHLICMEEPELHLHPTLQRKLIQYLSWETSNNYLISTHSAQMLNSEVASISHIEMSDKWSKVSSVVSSHDLSKAVSDLGNRASDLVQSNFVVWVEGPADRLYVRHWLKLHAPQLVEGAHFSIMFYGGALLNHLTVDDQETEDFIQLLRINRNLCVIIDSDKASKAASLNKTKERIIHELEAIEGQAWVTEGYTIENYVPSQQLQEIIDELYPGKGYKVNDDKYKSPIGHSFNGVTTKPSKVTVARKVSEVLVMWQEWSEHVRDNTQDLASRIMSANGL